MVRRKFSLPKWRIDKPAFPLQKLEMITSPGVKILAQILPKIVKTKVGKSKNGDNQRKVQ